MSLINQVLNELERRGENAALGEATVRAVPLRKQSNLMMYALAAVVVVTLLAGLMWYVQRQEANVALAGAPADEPKFELVAGLSEAAPAGASMPEAASSLDAQVAANTGVAPVASRLTLEMTSIPLPGSLRGKAVAENNAELDIEPIRKTPLRREPQSVSKSAATSATASANHTPNQYKKVSPRQQLENEYNNANQAAQQGRAAEAIAGYEKVLRLDPLYHDARRALVGVMLAEKRNADAERVLQEGLMRDSHESSFAMLLARLQVERDEIALALDTLLKALPYADRQPEYHGFVAALLQRQNRHKDAITHYQTALQLVPGNGIWLMGLGISLQAEQRNAEARDVYQRALGTNALNPQLQAFVQQKLKEL